MNNNIIRRSAIWPVAAITAAATAISLAGDISESSTNRTPTTATPPAITITLERKPDTRNGIPNDANFAAGYMLGLDALAQDREGITISPNTSALSRLPLAKAIVRAADLGATAIDLSITACTGASRPVDARAVAGALYYAAVVRDVAGIAVAGNPGGQEQGCQSSATATTPTRESSR